MTSRRVLLVDDEDDIRLIAAVALERLAGWEVASVGSGEEAVRSAHEERPDVIVLDVMMPGMDGPATLAALRRSAETATIPIVFLTAKVQADERRRLEELGAVGVIPKPFNPMVLAAALTTLLGWD